jgi:hypothetical protein
MGPRSIDRGNKTWGVMYPPQRSLQWGRYSRHRCLVYHGGVIGEPPNLIHNVAPNRAEIGQITTNIGCCRLARENGVRVGAKCAVADGANEQDTCTLHAYGNARINKAFSGSTRRGRSSQPSSVHTLDTESESGKASPLVSPLFKRGPLGCAALLTLITLRVLLPRRGDVRTVSPVENGRHVGPTKGQDVAVRVFR